MTEHPPSEAPPHTGGPTHPSHVGPRPPGQKRTSAVFLRTAAPAGVLAAVAGAFGYVGVVDPNESGHYPLCPLLRFTGLLCPGCGSLRSAHALAHGDLTTAVGANALFVVGCAALSALWALWFLRSVRGRPGPSASLRPVHWWSMTAVVAVFTLVRNLPAGSGLAP